MQLKVTDNRQGGGARCCGRCSVVNAGVVSVGGEGVRQHEISNLPAPNKLKTLTEHILE